MITSVGKFMEKNLRKFIDKINFCGNSKMCILGSMYAYVVLFVTAYIFFGCYLIYVSTILSDNHKKMYMWVSYFAYPIGILHPFAIGMLDENLKIIFSVYFILSIIFWIFVYHLYYKNNALEMFLDVICAMFVIIIILLFSSQMFYTFEFGKCINKVYSIQLDCANIDRMTCYGKRNNAQAGYFFMILTGATLVPVQKNFDMIDNHNITCNGHIQELKNYAYFSSAIGSIIMLILAFFILGGCVYMIMDLDCNGCIKDCTKDIKKTWTKKLEEQLPPTTIV